MSRDVPGSAPDRDEVIAALRSFFGAYSDPHELVAVYLYGSVARGQGRPDSDVDIAVLYAARRPSTLDALPMELEVALTRLLRKRVQIVVLNQAPVDLVHRVLRDGVLIEERDRARRVAFEVDARNRYWDMAPILQQYRAARAPR
jgi:predicted nucleotidyltransferase